MKILVTGANGMIGFRLTRSFLEAGYEVIGADRSPSDVQEKNYSHYTVDLTDANKVEKVFEEESIDRVIHLAALAHTEGERDLSWEKYHQINVVCSQNVFKEATERKIPVLYISTIDVYGFTESIVTSSTPAKPISKYGRSKRMAEKELERMARERKSSFTIFRLAPVYSDDVKRDIQKRYYLKYPYLAYVIGKGQHYEILNIKRAIEAMVAWCGETPSNEIRIIKDKERMWTPDYIKIEQGAGRAKFVAHVPKWTVDIGYALLISIFGRNEKMYLLSKAAHPMMSEVE